MSGNLCSLPTEMLDLILRHLDYQERRNLASTCRALRGLMPGQVQVRLRDHVWVRSSGEGPISPFAHMPGQRTTIVTGAPFEMVLAIPAVPRGMHSRGILSVVMTLSWANHSGYPDSFSLTLQLEREGEVLESDITRYKQPNL